MLIIKHAVGDGPAHPPAAAAGGSGRAGNNDDYDGDEEADFATIRPCNVFLERTQQESSKSAGQAFRTMDDTERKRNDDCAASKRTADPSGKETKNARTARAVAKHRDRVAEEVAEDLTIMVLVKITLLVYGKVTVK